MKTLLTDSIDDASGFIRAGGIVAFPTETVYGLGASVFDEDAIARVFRAKGRPADNPLIVHVGSTGQISTVVENLTEDANRLIEKFFPGPLTIVLKKRDEIPEIATAGLDTVGVRMPDHEQALELINRSGTPLVAPSANLSGRPSPTSWEAVADDLEGKIDCILKGETTRIGIESTVVDLSGKMPRLLRPGGISIEELRKIVPEIEPAGEAVDAPMSPGLKHRHYQPRAKVRIVESGTTQKFEAPAAYIGVSKPNSDFEEILVCDSVGEYAAKLFSFFRNCDHGRLRTICCERVSEDGIGAALMDRIRRAAAE